MADIGNTNVSLNTVRTVLGYTTNYHLFDMGVSSLINKWSRKKPIRDAGNGTNWPSGSNGKYGLNVTTDWSYLQPRGGSPGGSLDEPVRLGDFRGYEHNQDIAGPVVYAVLAGIDIDGVTVDPTAPSPTYGFNYYKNEAPHNDVEILPIDLSLDSWYWCLKISNATYTKYKSSQVTLVNSTYISVDYSLGTITMGDTIPGFTDAPPYNGSMTYELGICFAKTPDDWTTSTPPTGYFTLPEGTYGSKTCIISGSYTVNDWIWVSDDTHSWTWGTTTGKDSGIRTSLLNWDLISKPSWINIQVYANDAGVHGAPVNDSSNYGDDQWIEVSPTINYGGNRSGEIELGDGLTVLRTISVSQTGQPPEFAGYVFGTAFDGTTQTTSPGAYAGGSISYEFSVSGYSTSGIVTPTSVKGMVDGTYTTFYTGSLLIKDGINYTGNMALDTTPPNGTDLYIHIGL